MCPLEFNLSSKALRQFSHAAAYECGNQRQRLPAVQPSQAPISFSLYTSGSRHLGVGYQGAVA
jgi:hypothetical protein